MLDRVASVRFWGASRVIVASNDAFEVYAWPRWQLVGVGEGRALPEPWGGRLAVVRSDGCLELQGRVLRPPDSTAPPTWAWASPDGLFCAVGSESRHEPGTASLLPVPTAGPTGQTFGSYPERAGSLWWVPTSGAEPSRRRWFRTVDWPRRLGVLPGTPPLAVVENVCGEIIDTARSWRLEVVDPDGGCRDLLPQVAGSTSAFAAAPVGDRFACSHWDSPVTAPFPLPVLTASDGPVRHAVPPAVRAHGEPVWSPDGQRIAVTAWEGIRVGIIVVDAERGSWRWLEPAEGCCSAVALAPEDGTAVAVFQPVNDAPAVCRIDGGGKTPLLPLPAPGGPMPSLVRWSAAGASLEGLLLTPPGSGPWPLIVDLHGGPNQGLRVGDRGRLLDWSRAGYAAFAPDHRGSGIAGRESMLTQWTGAPDSHGGSEAGDVLAGVDHLVARGIADPARLFLIGFSAGAWLAAHIITIDGRFLAAVTWEGAYDLRLQHHRLGGLESMVQLLGGRPHETPERWALASPVSRADAVRTPVLVLAAERNGLLQGTVWWTALRDRGVPTELVVYRDESHVNQRGENDADVIRRSLAWFRRHC